MGEGFVNVSDEECRKIAESLGLSFEEFLERYTRQEDGFERWLIDGDGPDEPCVFLERDENGLASCRIEGEAKPEQCKTFPHKWRLPAFEKWCAGMREADADRPRRRDEAEDEA